MSRIGRAPIPIPAGVEVSLDGHHIKVKGPKGELERDLHPNIGVEIKEGTIYCTRPTETKQNKSLHGLTRALIFNMVEGVTNGYSKTLEISGVGYRAEKRGNNLVMNLGYSHPVEIADPDGIVTRTEGTTRVIVEGINKEQVGQHAAIIRAKRPPEPYKGHGIRYSDERIRRKVGKTG